MFSLVSVCHSVQGGPVLTITHDSLDVTVQGLLAPASLHVTSGSHHWRPAQTCSLDLTVQASPGIDI